MNLHNVVEDVKGRVEAISDHGHKVAEISLDSLKQAGDLVAESFQTLLSENTTAAKDLYAAAISSYEKARIDGFKAVAAAPISYLPPAEKLRTPLNQTVTVVSRTGDELYRVVKTGFSSIQAQLSGKPVTVEKVVKAAKSGARKASAAAKKTASKLAD